MHSIKSILQELLIILFANNILYCSNMFSITYLYNLAKCSTVSLENYVIKNVYFHIILQRHLYAESNGESALCQHRRFPRALILILVVTTVSVILSLCVYTRAKLQNIIERSNQISTVAVLGFLLVKCNPGYFFSTHPHNICNSGIRIRPSR